MVLWNREPEMSLPWTMLHANQWTRNFWPLHNGSHEPLNQNCIPLNQSSREPLNQSFAASESRFTWASEPDLNKLWNMVHVIHWNKFSKTWFLFRAHSEPTFHCFLNPGSDFPEPSNHVFEKYIHDQNEHAVRNDRERLENSYQIRRADMMIISISDIHCLRLLIGHSAKQANCLLKYFDQEVVTLYVIWILRLVGQWNILQFWNCHILSGSSF